MAKENEEKYKITLPSGKVVALREMSIKMKNQCVEAVALAIPNAAPPVFQARLQDEMVKALLVNVNGKVPSGSEREDLDQLFTMKEYGSLGLALTEIVGEVAEKKPKIELVQTNS